MRANVHIAALPSPQPLFRKRERGFVSAPGSQDTVVVTGTSVQSGIGNGQPWSGRFRFTRVWVKRDDAWKMITLHSSRIAEPK